MGGGALGFALLAAGLATSGCAADDASTGAWDEDESGLSTGGGGEEAGDGEGGSSDTGSGGTMGDGDGDDDGSGDGDGDGDGDGGPSTGPCDEIDCGLGTCVEVVLDVGQPQAFCDCPEGTAASPDGKACLECLVPGETFEIDVPSVSVSGAITVGGQAPPASLFDSGDIVFENVSTGDRVVVGNTRDQSYGARVVPGVYDVYFELRNGGIDVPRNEHALLTQVAAYQDLDFSVDVPMVRTSGPIQVGGQSDVGSGFDSGSIYLTTGSTGDRALLGTTAQGEFSDVPVIPGTYELTYGLDEGGASVPRNTWASFGVAEVVGGELPLEVDVPVIEVDATVTINQSEPPPSAFDSGLVVLERSGSASDRVVLGTTAAESLQALVIPGEYRAVYELATGGVQVPVNEHAVFQESVMVDGEEGVLPLALDIKAHSVSGTVSLNGGPTPSSEFDDGRLWLEGDAGDRAQIGNTKTGSFSALVVEGSYELHYGVETPGPSIPVNTDAVLQELALLSDASLPVNLQSVPVTGGITINSELPPQSVYQSGRIMLRDESGASPLLLGRTHQGGYATNVLVGSYELFYMVDTDGQGVPDNQNGRIGSFDAFTPTSADINVPMRSLAGALRLDGEAPPASPSESGRIYLRQPGAQDSVFVGATHEQAYSSEFVPGVYDVYYLEDDGASSLPSNTSARVTCIVVD